jgi:AcrR family transcriptional regulator
MIFLVSSSAEPTNRKTESYHHGNLRQTLLEAARDLAAEVGVDAFTLREVARRAGVSHAAPYHHFHDKSALVRALAIDAFDALAQEMIQAANTQTDPMERFRMTGVAYVRFAFKRPSEFRFMFRKDLCLPEDTVPDELETVSRTAYQVLVDSITACQQTGQMPPEDTQILALTAWSTMHGLASLLLDAPTNMADTLEGAEGVARAVTRILGIGLMTRDNTVPHANKKHRPARSSG